jgi:hypothetical protein
MGHSVCEKNNCKKCYVYILSLFGKLIKLYLPVPVTTATAERAFSALNRFKKCTSINDESSKIESLPDTTYLQGKT